MNKKLCILGSTGSVGTQVIDVVSLMKDRYTITGLSAFQNREQLFRQAEDLHVRHVSLAKKPAEGSFSDLTIEYGTEVAYPGFLPLSTVSGITKRSIWQTRKRLYAAVP